jgi:HlyD family secretion protein
MRLSLDRALLAAGLVAAAAMIGWWLVPRPLPVETAQVSRGRFVATVDEDGKTRVRERYVVSAPLAGISTRVRLKPGDQVAAGDVLASIQPTPAPFLDARSRREAEERLGATEATRERTRAAVDRGRAQSDQAKADLDRTRQLAGRGVATVQTLERAELAARIAERDLRAAEFQDHVAEHEVEQAAAVLARYDRPDQAETGRWNVIAPVAGVILKVVQESETVVPPGSPLVEIADPRDLEVVVDVLSTDALEIHPGAEVAIVQWGGPGELQGRVRRVEPAAFTKISTLGVEEQRVNVLVDVVSPPELWQGLGDAFRVDARITVFSHDDATIIPAGAAFRAGRGWFVFVVVNGRAERRPIELLRRSGRLAAISSGLDPGETVIVYPPDGVAPGVRVSTN